MPDNRKAFPVCAKPAHWSSALGRKKLRGCPTRQSQLSRSCNLASDGIPSGTDGSAGIDKHRHLLLITAGTEDGFPLPSLPINVSGVSIWSGRVENGTELARIGGEHADVDFAPAVGVAFGAGGPASDASVRETFYAIREMVKVILGEFLWFFHLTLLCSHRASLCTLLPYAVKG